MAVIVLLFLGGLLYGTLVSLGWQPIIGRTEISLSAYHSVMFSEQYAQVFWQGLALTIWVSVGSTFISAILALATALLLRRTFIGKRIATFLYQLNSACAACGSGYRHSVLVFAERLDIPHRRATRLVQLPARFPVLVKDKYGIGMMLSFIWKKCPLSA